MFESNDKQLKVAIYLRVSTDDQAEKFGLPMQKESILSLIKSKGKFINDDREKMIFAGPQYLYIDEGISGTTPIEERPQFSRLMEDVLNAPKDKPPFDAVAVYKIDRFARKLSVLVKIIEFFELHEIKMLSANESIDTSTAFGRAVLSIIGVIAELEIETFKQRSSDGRKQAIKNGVFMGESPPYGYIKNLSKTLEIQPDEALVVREIYRLFINELKSPKQIADHLQSMQELSPSESALKYQKKRGKSKKKNKQTFWRDLQIRKILSDEIYIGYYYFGKSKKGIKFPREKWQRSEYIYPNIIEKADFAIAQRRLNNSRAYSLSKNRAKEGKHIYLLSGLLKCEQCLEQHRTDEMPTWVGEPKKVKKKNKEKSDYSYYYKCGRRKNEKYSDLCNVITLPADQIESIVQNQVMDLLNNPEPVINYQNKLKSQTLEIDQLRDKKDSYIKLINSIPDRIERLREQHEVGIIKTLEELSQKIKEQEITKNRNIEELTALEKKIGRTVLSKNYISTLKFFQDKYQEALNDIQNNREFLHEINETLIEKIVVRARPVSPEDVVSGRRKKDQYIPHKLDIYFKLPKDMLKEAFFRFGLKNADL